MGEESRMIRSELVHKLCQDFPDLTQREVESVVASLFDSIIEQLARKGMAILMASSEMEEIIGICDRVLVMHEGGISGELVRAEITSADGEERIMSLATGRLA